MRVLTGGENVKACYVVSCLIVESEAAEVIHKTLMKAAAKLMANLMVADKVSKASDSSALFKIKLHMWPKT